MLVSSLLSPAFFTLLVGSTTALKIRTVTVTETACTSSTPKPTYQSCGGFRIKPVECPSGAICIDDPYAGGCGMACDAPGICVKPEFCGGIAGFVCKDANGQPDGRICVDDPRDNCDPKNGGADCGGICV